MPTFLKLNSDIPEFYGIILSKSENENVNTITETPEGYKEVSDEDIEILQNAMQENPNGKIVNGLWSPL